ncbi:calcium-binding protein [Leisingera thetidis]|uniref:calcium-binding protein n=1 Tax=Leisingera thetidis TaxID=2930199 RepID=UPI0025758A3B|nr:calcium-binding protein [Leisingera thetidis]
MALAFTGRFAAEDLIFGTDLRDLEIAVQDGQATLYAATGMNGGISRWQLAADGSLPQAAGQQLHGQAGIRTGEFHLAAAGGGRLVQGQTSQGDLVFYQLESDGSLGSRDRAALSGADAGGFGAVAVLELADGKAAFYAVGAASGGLQGWQLDAAGGELGRTGAAGGSGSYSLDPAALLATVQTADGPVLLAADAQGLHSYRADAASGALRPADGLGAEQGLSVSGITALEGFEADGKAWALIGAAGSSSLTLVRVKADGDLRFEAQLQDTAMTRFGGLSALEVVAADGHVLVLAAGNDGGLSLFTLAPGAGLIHLQSLEHVPGLGLQNVTALEAVAAGGMLQVFAASGAAGGISQFTLPLADLGEVRMAAAADARLDGSGADDVLEGGRSGARIYGEAGDDVLVAGTGGGWLTGGSGADSFVINPAAEGVTVRDFTPGEDRLDLSLFTGLYNAGQLNARERSAGMVMEAEGTRIVLMSADGAPLALEDVFGPSLRFAFPERQDPGVTLPGGGFYGGSGSDRIGGTGGGDGIFGLGGKDRLDGGAGRDTLAGGDGRDTLLGGAGRDRLDGGGGRDTLLGGAGRDRLDGGGGRDTLQGGTGDDVLKGGSGDDLLRGGEGADKLFGEAGTDLLKGGSGDDALQGGSGNDSLAGEDGDDLLAGGGGRDRLEGGAGRDRLDGGAGRDTLQGGSGDDVLKGAAAEDLLRGGAGADKLFGQAGADTLQGGSGDDALQGGSGDDSLAGEDGDDLLAGGGGRDRLEGGGGSDRLEGHSSRDTLQGGGGADLLDGGAGDDLLRGGSGADVFVFAGGHGDDRIADFTAGSDRISLAGTGAGRFGELDISRAEGGTLISTGSGSIFLDDLGPGQLGADDFLF